MRKRDMTPGLYLQRQRINGVTYYYFRPSDEMRALGFERESLGFDEEAAAVRVAAIRRAWEHECAILQGHSSVESRQAFVMHFRKMIRNAKQRARRRGVSFELTINDVAEMAALSRMRCAVSGLPFDLTKHAVACRRPFSPSIDRRDNSLGYDRPNCRIVCSIVNYAMGEWGEDALLHVARAIVAENERRRFEQNGFAKCSKTPGADADIASQPVDFAGGGYRARTYDPLIKSLPASEPHQALRLQNGVGAPRAIPMSYERGAK